MILMLLGVVVMAALIVGPLVVDVYKDYEHQVAIQSLIVEPETIIVEGLIRPQDFPEEMNAFRGQKKVAALTTSEWVLLNGPSGSQACPVVLEDFGRANSPHDAISVAGIELLFSSYSGGNLPLLVRIPRYEEKPRGIENCVGFRYDRETTMIYIGTKKVAFLESQQSRRASK